MSKIILLIVLMITALSGCSDSESAHRKLLANARDGNVQIVRVLLERGHIANINAMDERCNTALMLAAENGHATPVRFLFEKGANVHLKNLDGQTALSLAETQKHTGIVEILKAAGATL